MQLEKVSAATLSVQTFDSRIEQIQSQVNLIEEKLLNISKVTHLSQQVIEKIQQKQEEYEIKLERDLTTRFQKLRMEMEAKFKKLMTTDDNSPHKLRADMDAKFNKHQKLMEDWMLKLNNHMQSQHLHQNVEDLLRAKKITQSSSDSAESNSIVHKTLTIHEDKLSILTEEFHKLRSDIEKQVHDFEQRTVVEKQQSDIEDRKTFVKRDIFDKVENLIMARLNSVELLSQKFVPLT